MSTNALNQEIAMQALTKRLDELLKDRSRERTGRRVLDLAIELNDETIVLRGVAASYHVKQLAQHGVRELLPDRPLRNAIAVPARMT